MKYADRIGDVDFVELYKALCEEIHGYPWSGQSVRVYWKDLSPSYTDIIVFLVNRMQLKVEKVPKDNLKVKEV